MRNRRTGMTLVYLTITMMAMIGMASLAVDYGRVQTAKTQIRSATDAAARAGALTLSTGGTSAQAVSAAIAAAAQNPVDCGHLTLQSGDVTVGTWSGGVFSAGGSSPNAVEVTAQCSTARGTSIPLLFAQVLGCNTCNIHASSIAMFTAPKAGYGFVALGGMNLSGKVTIDSYDPADGAYSASTAQSTASVAVIGNVNVSNSVTIKGDVLYDPYDQLNISGTVSVSGSMGSITSLTEPTPSLGSVATTNNDSSISSSYYQGGNLNISSGTLNLEAGTYYFSSINMSGGTINMTGAVTIYITGAFNFSGGTINTSGNTPSNFQLYSTGSGGLNISGGSALYAEIDAPLSNLNYSRNADVYGSIIANTYNISSTVGLHDDETQDGSGASKASLSMVK